MIIQPVRRAPLENPGKVAMVLIEVQTGSYLGGDVYAVLMWRSC